MSHRFTAHAVVVGNRAGTVVPDAVLDMDDGRITWVGPASEAPPAPGADVVALPACSSPGW
jgi:5-methylthioadenosine/S-adenosylhomocysteine deaminase